MRLRANASVGLTFGRLLSIHTNATFYGWASVALVGLAYYVATLIKAHLQTVLADCHLHVTQMIEMRSLSDKSRAQIVGLRNEYEEIVLNLIRFAQRTNEISSRHGPKELTLGLLNLMNWTMFWY